MNAHEKICCEKEDRKKTFSFISGHRWLKGEYESSSSRSFVRSSSALMFGRDMKQMKKMKALLEKNSCFALAKQGGKRK